MANMFFALWKYLPHIELLLVKSVEKGHGFQTMQAIIIN